nr:MAG TPA: hypothetical protein [Caudoviricetes sp.]
MRYTTSGMLDTAKLSSFNSPSDKKRGIRNKIK